MCSLHSIRQPKQSEHIFTSGIPGEIPWSKEFLNEIAREFSRRILYNNLQTKSWRKTPDIFFNDIPGGISFGNLLWNSRRKSPGILWKNPRRNSSEEFLKKKNLWRNCWDKTPEEFLQEISRRNSGCKSQEKFLGSWKSPSEFLEKITEEISECKPRKKTLEKYLNKIPWRIPWRNTWRNCYW